MSKSGILFAGDFCPQERVTHLIDQDKLSAVFNDVLPELEKCNWIIVDLECPLIAGGMPIAKTGPHLKTHPDSIKALQFAGVSAVALANNHILDYGAEGLLQTKRICEEAGIKTVGAGASLAEARVPVWLVEAGKNIAILNITENEWSNTYGPDPGANPLDLPKNFSDIKRARQAGADLVFVIYHGGNEFYELPSPRLKETLRFFVEAGASAVIAHHTHVVSGYEVYQGAPIFYGLGNFCFDWPGKRGSEWNKGLLVRLFPDDLTRFELIPVIQNDDEPGVRGMTREEQQVFDDRLSKLNSIIADDQQLAAQFDFFCQKMAQLYGIYLEPYRHPWLASLRKRGWLPSVFGRKKRNLYLNLMRCEAHRDVLQQYLKK